MGIGYVEPELATEGQQLQVRMFRDLYPATICAESPYDPTNAAIRLDG
ncbi:MAG: glycine cleavage T C-terminal barrel domain-containing protein [Pseudomonadota bacterium]